MKNRPCIIVDLDGTMCDNSHRKHFIETPGKKKNWPMFYANLGHDKPNWPVLNCVRALAERYEIVICTGRPGEYHEGSKVWLDRFDAPYTAFYGRAENDCRDDAVVKLELLARMKEDGYYPMFALDDRDRVVAMWRAAGVPCFQVAPGAF